MLSKELTYLLEKFLQGDRQLMVLTGAGVSAESGIPTYRGVEGYWTKGSRNYKPEEIGTLRFFQKKPEEVWKFALYRRTICKRAQPNLGHTSIAKLENIFRDRFTLITQNVDGLHLKAGNSDHRTYQIHGDIDHIRCSLNCTRTLYEFPQEIGEKKQGEGLTGAEWELLRCPECDAICRPNVLWFDEFYNERYYRSESALKIAGKTGLLLIVGTMGTTNLPNQIFDTVRFKQGIVVDINLEDNLFSEEIRDSRTGFLLRGKSSELLPQLVDEIRKLRGWQPFEESI
ncbi:Sir2 family NAD-dependent protein deacetylase [Rapidithrix thailandica]|uniref:protein acetyllysine N-acetyltransferase n=1 Tax=Rapidithrix thailandica TaxID=413964 RepID=A0AAW9S0U4_9BACT